MSTYPVTPPAMIQSKKKRGLFEGSEVASQLPSHCDQILPPLQGGFFRKTYPTQLRFLNYLSPEPCLLWRCLNRCSLMRARIGLKEGWIFSLLPDLIGRSKKRNPTFANRVHFRFLGCVPAEPNIETNIIAFIGFSTGKYLNVCSGCV